MIDYNWLHTWHGTGKEEYNIRLANIDNEIDMNESDIRTLLNNHLEAQKFDTIAERNLRSANEHPFDLVSGCPDDFEMIGYEIKGDKDNYKLLGKQLQVYKTLFDKTYIVLHKKQKPEWLPENTGVLRIFATGEIYEEVGCYRRDEFDIGSDYEWDTLLKANTLGVSSKRTKEVLGLIKSIRRNIMYNRFFGVLDPEIKSYQLKKFYPLTDRQKELLIGFDVPYHYELIDKDIKAIEKRIKIIRKICNIEEEELK